MIEEAAAPIVLFAPCVSITTASIATIHNVKDLYGCMKHLPLTKQRLLKSTKHVSTFYSWMNNGGAYRDRTDDPLLAKQVLSQLS